jgi:hypothetical protein
MKPWVRKPLGAVASGKVARVYASRTANASQQYVVFGGVEAGVSQQYVAGRLRLRTYFKRYATVVCVSAGSGVGSP